MNIQYCANCNQYISDNIYRGFDNSYCSQKCRVKMWTEVYQLDPEYNKPNKWKIHRSDTKLNIIEERYDYSQNNSCCENSYFMETIRSLWNLNKIITSMVSSTIINKMIYYN